MDTGQPQDAQERDHGWVLVAVFVAMMAGLALFAWMPLWLLPPHVVDTILIYGVLLFAWLPLLVWWVARHSAGRVAVIIAALVWFGLGLCFALTLNGPDMALWLAGGQKLHCEQSPAAGGSILHRCGYTASEMSGGGGLYYWIQPAGLPLMWRTSGQPQ